MKFRIIASILVVAVVFGLYVLVEGGRETMSIAPAIGNSDFSADSINSMKR